MRRSLVLALVLALPAAAVNVTKLAAVTTIGINLLDIKVTIQKARAAARVAKAATTKAAAKAKQVLKPNE